MKTAYGCFHCIDLEKLCKMPTRIASNHKNSFDRTLERKIIFCQFLTLRDNVFFPETRHLFSNVVVFIFSRIAETK